MSSQVVGISINTTAMGAGVNQTLAGLGRIKTTAEAVPGVLGRITSGLAGFAAGAIGITAIASAFKNAVSTGVQFNATLEDARLGVAAIIKQFNPTAYKSFDDALKRSSQAIEELKRKAVESPASFRELVQGFQAISGAASGARIALKDQVDLVVIMSQALAGLGIRPEQLIQESRALITGNINHNAAAARMLGITKQDIDLAREQGRVYEFLRGKLSAFAEAGKLAAGNFSVAWSNLKDIIEIKLGETLLPVFEALKAGFQTLFKEIGSAEVAKSFRDSANALAFLVEKTFDLARFGVKNLSAFVTVAEALLVVLTAIAARAAMLGGLALLSGGGIGRGLGAFGAVNAMVATLSKSGGAITGLIAAFSTLTGAISLMVSAFAGWKIGSWINDIDLLGKGVGEFGIKIKDVVTFNILKAMEAWEKLKRSFGQGSDSQVKGVQDAIQQLLAPGLSSGLTNRTKDPEPPIKLATRLETLKAFLTELDGRESVIKSGQLGRDPKGINEMLKGIYQERIAILKQYQDAVIGNTSRVMAVEGKDGEPVFSEEYANKVQEITELTKKLNEENEKLRDVSRTGFFAGISDGLDHLTQQFDDVGRSIADVLVNGIAAAIDTVADGIWAVVDGTATWGDLFIQVGRQIISDLIRIALQEYALAGIKKALAWSWSMFISALNKKQAVEENVTEATKTPLKATNAILSSIGSWGVAAVIGLAAVTAALAMAGSFDKGGVVGGGEQFIRVNESGTESVLNSRATSFLGESMINRMNAGAFDDLQFETSSRGQGGMAAPEVNVLIVDTRNSQAARDFIASSAGRVQIVELIRANKTDSGIS